MSMSSVDEEMQQQRCFIKQILHKKDQKTAIATSGSISTAHKQHIIHHWSVKSRL